MTQPSDKEELRSPGRPAFAQIGCLAALVFLFISWVGIVYGTLYCIEKVNQLHVLIAELKEDFRKNRNIIVNSEENLEATAQGGCEQFDTSEIDAILNNYINRGGDTHGTK